tara:strand:- start:5426 stop:6430 length:1005 start_codon:yes stop_codon:yes gene_type:complete
MSKAKKAISAAQLYVLRAINANGGTSEKGLTGKQIFFHDHRLAEKLEESGLLSKVKYDMVSFGWWKKDFRRSMTNELVHSAGEFYSREYCISFYALTDAGLLAIAANAHRKDSQQIKAEKAAQLEPFRAAVQDWTGIAHSTRANSRRQDGADWCTASDDLTDVQPGDRAYVHAQGAFRRAIVVSVTAKRVRVLYTNEDAGTEYDKTVKRDAENLRMAECHRDEVAESAVIESPATAEPAPEEPTIVYRSDGAYVGLVVPCRRLDSTIYAYRASHCEELGGHSWFSTWPPGFNKAAQKAAQKAAKAWLIAQLRGFSCGTWRSQIEPASTHGEAAL